MMAQILIPIFFLLSNNREHIRRCFVQVNINLVKLIKNLPEVLLRELQCKDAKKFGPNELCRIA